MHSPHADREHRGLQPSQIFITVHCRSVQTSFPGCHKPGLQTATYKTTREAVASFIFIFKPRWSEGGFGATRQGRGPGFKTQLQGRFVLVLWDYRIPFQRTGFTCAITLVFPLISAYDDGLHPDFSSLIRLASPFIFFRRSASLLYHKVDSLHRYTQ